MEKYKFIKEVIHWFIMSFAFVAIIIMLIIEIKSNESVIKKITDNEDRYTFETDNEYLVKTIQTLIEVDNMYDTYYVGEVDYTNLESYVVNSMIDAYGDEHGEFLDYEATKDFNEKMENQFFGIGVLVRVEYEDNGDFKFYVMKIYKDSPADKVGIKTGDLITEVNKESFNIENITPEEVLSNITGEEGTLVNITIQRENGEEIYLDVERQKVKTDDIDFEIIDNSVGYIKIYEISNDTDVEFKEALNYLKSKEVEKLIIDLRDNGGGLLSTIESMLDDILPEGEQLKIKDGNNRIIQTFNTDNEFIEFKDGITCLVNANTASAAEMMAQALKDNELATIIGTETYGKGTVCISLYTSNENMVSVSIQKYFTKSDRDIEELGVEIDVKSELSDEDRNILYKIPLNEDKDVLKALEILNKK